MKNNDFELNYLSSNFFFFFFEMVSSTLNSTNLLDASIKFRSDLKTSDGSISLIHCWLGLIQGKCGDCLT